MVTEKKTSEKLQETETSEKFIIETKKNTFKDLQKAAGDALVEELKKGNATSEEVFEAYRKCDGLTLAKLVKNEMKTKVTASKLLEIALRRYETVEPKINAVTYQIIKKASDIKESDLPNGTFKGVPFLIKDSTEMKGVPTSNGSRLFKELDKKSEKDSDIVTSYKKAGLVIFGKTNMPEFGNKGVTEPEAWLPATRNPWNLEYSPGGSSGGAAAAVAAGIVPVAQGSDQGGSLRVPASCTGLFGLIPTDKDLFTSTKHVISRSVRDSAAMLNVIQDKEDQKEVNKGKEEINDTDKTTFRIMYWSPENKTNPYREYGVHEECLKAVMKAVEHLKGLGHELQVEEKHIISDDQEDDQYKLYDRYAELMFKMMCFWMINNVKNADVVKKFGEKAVQELELELETKFMLELGKEMQEEQGTVDKDLKLKDLKFNDLKFNDLILQIQKLQKEISENIKKNLFGDENYDFYLTPTLAKLPPKIGELTPKDGSWEKTLMEAVVAGDSIDKTLVKIETPKFKQDKEAQAVVEKMKEFAPKVKNLSSLVLKSEVYLQIARVRENLALAPWALLAFMTGNPAMSVPLHWTEDGIPVGVEFMAIPNQKKPEGEDLEKPEDLLFRLAGQLEQKMVEEKSSWFGRVPIIPK